MSTNGRNEHHHESENDSTRLSYKFQRLREALRDAVVRGEFASRLPGERELGRRFGANAKTINKALSDLCAEGLLIRQIGRGTFVTGGTREKASDGPQIKMFLVLGPSDPDESARSEMLDVLSRRASLRGHRLIRASNALCQSPVIGKKAWPTEHRRQTTAMVFCPRDPLGAATGLPDAAILTEAHRRQVSVCLLGAEGDERTINAVVPDYAEAGFQLAEHCCRMGCSELVVVVAGPSRQAARAVAGCESAAARRGRPIRTVHRIQDLPHGSQVLNTGGQTWLSGKGRLAGASSQDSTIGLICVGSEVARHVAIEARDKNQVITCICEPGERTGETLGISTYQFDLNAVVDRAVEFLDSLNPAQRPETVLVPGDLVVRGCAARPSGATDAVRAGSESGASGSPPLRMMAR